MSAQNIHLTPSSPSLSPLSGTCQLSPRQRVCLQWTSITHCLHRCLPSRSRLPTPAMPCLCRQPPAPPTHLRRTSRCYAATSCLYTRPSAMSPTSSGYNSSGHAPTCRTVQAACPPVHTGWPRTMTSTRARRRSHTHWSNQREAVDVGTGPD